MDLIDLFWISSLLGGGESGVCTYGKLYPGNFTPIMELSQFFVRLLTADALLKVLLSNMLYFSHFLLLVSASGWTSRKIQVFWFGISRYPSGCCS